MLQRSVVFMLCEMLQRRVVFMLCEMLQRSVVFILCEMLQRCVVFMLCEILQRSVVFMLCEMLQRSVVFMLCEKLIEISQVQNVLLLPFMVTFLNFYNYGANTTDIYIFSFNIYLLFQCVFKKLRIDYYVN